MHYENTGERCWSWPELIKEKGNSFKMVRVNISIKKTTTQRKMDTNNDSQIMKQNMKYLKYYT